MRDNEIYLPKTRRPSFIGQILFELIVLGVWVAFIITVGAIAYTRNVSFF